MNYLSEKIKNRNANINVLRFGCAIAVILCHSYAVAQGKDDFISRWTNGQANLGAVAVAVFFFLSGLYVTKSLDKSESILSFLEKRSERIFPQLWVVVLFSVILGACITTLSVAAYLKSIETYKYLLNGLLIPVHDLPGVFGEMPYSTVNGPLWTMPVEFGCYIGLAFLALLSTYVFKNNEFRKRLEILTAGVLLRIYIYVQYKIPAGILPSVTRAVLLFFEGVYFTNTGTKYL